MKVVHESASISVPARGERVRVRTRAGIVDALVHEAHELLLVVEIEGELYDARLHFSPIVRPFWEVC